MKQYMHNYFVRPASSNDIFQTPHDSGFNSTANVTIEDTNDAEGRVQAVRSFQQRKGTVQTKQISN
jgi:hypothetical protein